MENNILLDSKIDYFFSDTLLDKNDSEKKFLNGINDFKNGKQTTLFVYGEMGVGKSFFINEMSYKLSDFDIHSGKFEKYKSNIPYFGIKQLFNSIFDSVEKLGVQEQKLWKSKFNSQFSFFYFELSNIESRFKIFFENNENQKNLNPAPGILKNRINQVVVDFLEFHINLVNNQSTAIILENIQWIDSDSLNLLKNLLNKNLNNLLIVLSKRSIETNRPKELGDFFSLDAFKKSMVKITLNSLTFEEQNKILNNIFQNNSNDLKLFQDYCFSKTNGNFIKLKSLLLHINRNNHFTYNNDSKHWEIDSLEIKNIDKISENSIEFIFNQLNDSDRLITQICSCFGTNLNTAFISKICNININDINKSFKKLNILGIIKPTLIDDHDLSSTSDTVIYTNYEFLNDLHQDFVKSSFDKIETRKIHRQIADYYIHDSVLGIDNRDVFDVVYHLNESIFKDSTIKEKTDHIRLNLKAAILAKETASYPSAFKYIKECLKYECHLDWKNNYLICSDVHIIGYELARINFNNEVANLLYNSAINNCNELEKNKLRLRKMVVDIQSGALKEALKTGIIALKDLGINIKENSTKITILREFLKTKIKMSKHSAESILALPKITDNKSILAQEIIFWLFRSAQYVNPTLNGVLALKNLQITLEKGSNRNSFTGFMAYGVIIGAGTNNYSTAYKFCEIGNDLAKKHNNNSGSVQFGKAVYSAFRFSLKDTLIYYKNAKSIFWKDGDLMSAAEPTVNESLTFLSTGLPLRIVQDKIIDNFHFCEEANMSIFRDFQTMLEFNVKKIRGLNITKDETTIYENINKNTSYSFTPVTAKVIELQHLCLQNRWNEAIVMAQNAKKDIQVLTGLNIFTEFHFYYALALLHQVNNLNGISKVKAKIKINSIIKKVEKWADSAPENFEHKLLLLQALSFYNSSDLKSSEEYLLKSAQSATLLGFIQISAIAYSYLSEVVKTNNKNKSDAYLIESNKLFEEWGYSKK